MTKKTLPMETLGSVLEQSLKRMDLVARLDEYAVWPVWNEVVGAVIARNAQPEKIRNGTLFIKVSSPVWMQQLQFMKEMIAGKLNQRLRGEIVKNIFFIVGRIDAPAEAAQSPQSAAEAAFKIDDTFLDGVEDPEIRSAFKQLLKSCSRRPPKV
jgi:predicted nucleic acid-binding Zn ribbon protein